MNWGRIFVGLVLVAAATVIAAYYVPLYRAHQVLSSDHRQVLDKAQSLERQAVELRGQLGRAESKVSALEAEKRAQSSSSEGASAGAGSDSAGSLKSDLSAKLDRTVKKGAAAVGAGPGRVVVALAESAVFAPGKLDVSASGKGTLCEIAKASGSFPLRVGAVEPNAKPAAALAAKYPSAWSLRAARASSVAQMLEDKCGVSAARLTAQGFGEEPATATFEGAKLSPSRIEIEIVTRDAAR